MVRFCGSVWPVLFGLGAIRALGLQVAPEDVALEWVTGLLPRLAADDPEAMVYALWAGLGAENCGFTPVELLTVLDDAEPSELETLASAILVALVESLPPRKEGESESGKPWDWNVAYAVWTTEWGQPAAEFWTTTLREFSALSDGRALLYASAGDEGATQEFEEITDPRELIKNGPRWGRRRNE